MNGQDPMERLSSTFHMTVDAETKERHIAEIAREIQTAPPVAVPSRIGLRRRVAALAAALVVFAPAAMAVAADDAVPGELLYPVKQATERVMRLFAPDIEATHRVEEVERLVVRRAPHRDITHALQRAESATAKLTNPGELQLRLEQARELLWQQNEQQVAEGDLPGSDRPPPGSGSGNTEPGDNSGDTKAPGPGGSSGHSGDQSGQTTTTSGHDDGADRGDAAGVGSMSESTSSTTSPKDPAGSQHP
ncbi:MAG: hypothetical protein ABFS21_02335 [Actinomycetota bacterium]